MIISASRRTDIPAFYSEWFFNRIKEGFVVTKNPFNAHQLTKLRLDSEVVDAIVFWTKNAAPMIVRLSELDVKGFSYYFQFTITPYEKDMEPCLPDKSVLFDTFKRLAEKIGRERVIWRYDPIFISDKYSKEWHVRKFEEYVGALHDSTEKVVISFLDMDYNNTKKINELGIRDGSLAEKNYLAEAMSAIAQSSDLEIATCAEEIDLAKYGIGHGRCIDDKLIERLIGCPLSVKKDKNQRDACGCMVSADIGIYNTCSHSCVYCYANFNRTTIATNREKHNRQSPLLIGDCDATVLDFKKDQKSLKEFQTSLFESIG
jgi:DNA repair photolyase